MKHLVWLQANRLLALLPLAAVVAAVDIAAAAAVDIAAAAVDIAVVAVDIAVVAVNIAAVAADIAEAIAEDVDYMLAAAAAYVLFYV